MLVNRLSASFVILFGLSLVYFIFPIEIEKLDYGWVRPQTLPNICSFLLIIFGLVQLVFPRGKVDIQFNQMLHIGDHQINDILGAYNLGIDTLWFNNNDEKWSQDFPKPDEFKSWDRLPKIIENKYE